MRILRPSAFTAATTAAVATVAAVLAAPHAASARSLFVSLTLSPSSGPSTTGVTATYQYVPLGRDGPGGCGAELVTFTWDGQRPLGAAKPRPAGNYCVAALTFTPPPGLAAPGRHTVAGTQGSDTAQATFTITGSTAPAPVPAPPSPSQSPSAAPSASPYPSPSGTPTATADPSASPPASTDPLPSDEPSYAAGPRAGGGATKPPGGGSTGTFLAVLLGVFTMAGGGILLTLALRRRPDIDGAELPEDVPPAEA